MKYLDYDERYIQTFEYEKTAINDGSLLGTCKLGKAEIQMINDSNQYSSMKGQWIKTVHGSFYIYDIQPVQEQVNVKLSCYDIRYLLDTIYDSSLYVFPQTLKEWRNRIFTNCGLKYDNTDFPNSDLILTKEPYIKKGSSNRDVISMIAQAGASWVDTINDVIYFKWFNNKVHIVKDWSSLTTEGKATSPINSVVLGRGDVEENAYYPIVRPDEPKELRIDNNYILDPQDVSTNEDLRYTTIVPIYNQVVNFSYIVFEMVSQHIDNKLDIKIGEKIHYVDIWDNEFETYVMSIKYSYLGGKLTDSDNWEVTLSAEEIKETSTDYSYASSIQNDILNVSRKADKNAGMIEDLITKTNDSVTKVTQLSQSIDEIKGLVSESADVTKSADGIGSIKLDNINTSQPIYIKVYPTSENISYLYPSDDLYPADDLFLLGRTLRFKNDNGYIVDYELPSDLLICNEVYDEFTLDLTSQECTVIKRVGVNNKGENYILETPVTRTYDYPIINLEEGNYTIYLVSFSSAYIFARLMTKNVYTEQFVTGLEMESTIKQNSTSILEKVAAQIEGLDLNIQAKFELYVDIKNLCSLISMSANDIDIEGNRIRIKSDFFELSKDGKILSTGGKIGGWTIGEHQLSCDIVPPYDYTESDIEKMRQYMLGNITLTSSEFKKYDINNDGVIDSADLLICRKLIVYNLKNTRPGKLILDTSDWFFPIRIVNSSNETLASFGVNGVFNKEI